MSGQAQHLQAAIQAYDSLTTIDIPASLSTLSIEVDNYSRDQSPCRRTALENALTPIETYYTGLKTTNTNLQRYLSTTANQVSDTFNGLVNKERYDGRAHPEESIASREVMNGVFPTLRPTSIPYVLTAGIFMLLLSLFIAFQMMGFTAQVNLPPAITAMISAPAQASLPFYKNPLVLGGAVVILISATVIFAALYFKQKKQLSGQ